ncbi:hypothetical protein DDB_G0287525 [Dictyostelium discoideum AX4]|uniref:Uncharacterized protein n=1 Tax=Dictyostelium discoideum TaxID=44689 RepID=Q54K88_DICDI|nr:hypothetical protein DDB_G0287525 [Dictyostelium discoideum AX4]EAL63662.1 hypothetical protein DDB_G0287525 [Dictyostelium discoideum AX4]|eukprot:XP_637167.1 hypothetical protein DDB_G0287525 [Dictyostelium discoideum AX4]
MSSIELEVNSIHSVVIEKQFILIHIETKTENEISEVEIKINDKTDEIISLRKGVKYIEKNLQVSGELKIINKGPSTINLTISPL